MEFERSSAGIVNTDLERYREVKARKKTLEENKSLQQQIKNLEKRIDKIERVLNGCND